MLHQMPQYFAGTQPLNEAGATPNPNDYYQTVPEYEYIPTLPSLQTPLFLATPDQPTSTSSHIAAIKSKFESSQSDTVQQRPPPPPATSTLPSLRNSYLGQQEQSKAAAVNSAMHSTANYAYGGHSPNQSRTVTESAASAAFQQQSHSRNPSSTSIDSSRFVNKIKIVDPSEVSQFGSAMSSINRSRSPVVGGVDLIQNSDQRKILYIKNNNKNLTSVNNHQLTSQHNQENSKNSASGQNYEI